MDVTMNDQGDGFQCRKNEGSWREGVYGTKIGNTGKCKNVGRLYRCRSDVRYGNMAYIFQHCNRNVFQHALGVPSPTNGLHTSGEGTTNQHDLIGAEISMDHRRFEAQETEVDTFG